MTMKSYIVNVVYEHNLLPAFIRISSHGWLQLYIQYVHNVDEQFLVEHILFMTQKCIDIVAHNLGVTIRLLGHMTRHHIRLIICS